MGVWKTSEGRYREGKEQQVRRSSEKGSRETTGS